MVFFSHDEDIDIPPEYWSIAKYRATLGHKINHSFKKTNCKLGHAIHPRFGPIRAFFATKDIKKGEELLWNYSYSQNALVPMWYARAYENEMGEPWPGKKVYNETNQEDIPKVRYKSF